MSRTKDEKCFQCGCAKEAHRNGYCYHYSDENTDYYYDDRKFISKDSLRGKKHSRTFNGKVIIEPLGPSVQIKFRAWNGKWMVDAAYGDWISFDGVPYTEAERKHNTPNIEIQKAKKYTVMQFTGLKDVNGHDAYYGDIIQHSTTEGGIFKRVLSWSDELCTLMVDDMPYYRLHESGYIQPSKLEFEIIGNIYQNPELIEGVNNN